MSEMVGGLPTYRYLNLEQSWPLVQLDRLEIDSQGQMRLASLPWLDANEPAPDIAVPPPGIEGPSGIGVDSCGNVYIADPVRHQVMRVSGCDGTVAPLRCLSGPGPKPGQLDTPRGVLVGRKDQLYIADTGNRRVQLIDLATGQLRGLWDRGFSQPWDIAEDSTGTAYVADPGERAADGTWHGGRVARLSHHGIPDADWTLGAPAPNAPSSVAITLLSPDAPDTERLLVLDSQPARLLVYRLDGSHDPDATRRWAGLADVTRSPASLAIAKSGVLHVADLTSGQVLTFGTNGRFLGVARGVEASAAGLALDCEGRLVATTGAGGIRRSLGLASYVSCGTFLAGPFEAGTEPTRWQRLHVTTDPLPEGAHFRLWTLTSRQNVAPGMPVDCAGNVVGNVVESEAIEPAALSNPPAQFGEWRAIPWDAADALTLNQPSTYLWIAGMLVGDGGSTPTIRQMRLVHDQEGWLRYLPALYSRDDTSRTFLERALALFETLYDREREQVDDLPLLFDPWAAPDTAATDWLDWLADWVGTELDESWGGTKRRETVARAFEVFGRRGTREVLRHLAALYGGADIYIEEPAVSAGLWGLGSPGSGLGFDTMLAPVQPHGAVLGSTALVNRSTLENEDPRGRPAFEDLAHQFTVRVHSAQVGAGKLERLRRVIEREKPAHTSFHLCPIEPRMRVGTQAQLGVDTVVGGPRVGGAFDSGRRLNESTELPDEPHSARRRTLAVPLAVK